ncbi:uncharacterized protein LY89DRAFT_780695 [Mollisia scopiformis]|uniref:Uncharacterized protein n=1 Tax=Mollisia scopiformis TaxID=149040 RepID=A0A194XER7_MOLSC|nr:uncharacterized protein LY89DRAFT_780695 [Mollisia scopiformis]KUJ18668.1 hypothetical protein LY89DRAFT_780695 [Mollisia scopiformis]
MASATLVLNTPKWGNIQQVQVGIAPADLVATLSAAKSAWGWIGGLDGIRHILTHLPRVFGEKQLIKMGVKMKINPLRWHIITSEGTKTIEDLDKKSAFGGNPATQLIGLTICALSFELGEYRAIKAFMENLAPNILIDAEAGASEALYSQLIDNFKKIVNEGAARGLERAFSNAIRSHNLPSSLGPCEGFDETDYMFVVGLLRWVIEGGQKSYLTRSAATARVAVGLKEIGYSIGPILVWNGKGEPPSSWKGVTLVTGGSCKTDALLAENEEDMLMIIPPIQHYHFDTVGPMLFNLMRLPNGPGPELLQADFNNVRHYIQTNLHFTWELSQEINDNYVRAVAHWKPTRGRPHTINLTLASICFGASATNFAGCYSDISNEQTLSIIKKHNNTNQAASNPEVLRFRAITTAILISVAETLSGPLFGQLSHITSVDLRGFSGLDGLSRGLGTVLASGIPYWKAVAFVSVFHSCADTQLFCGDSYTDRGIVGFRERDYAVLPALLFNLSPTPDALGIYCVDEFYSLPVQEDNTIRSHEGDCWSPESWNRPEDENPGIKSTYEAATGVPSTTEPDIPIYISIERDPTLPKPFICLAGRVDGKLIGATGITSILKTLALSFRIPETCPEGGHQVPHIVRHTKASQWSKHRVRKPTDQVKFSNYIAVAGHPLWTVFLAGQAAQTSTGGLVVFGCFECAQNTMKSMAFERQQKWSEAGNLFVGYGKTHDGYGQYQRGLITHA